jgi:hypothetical protein
MNSIRLTKTAIERLGALRGDSDVSDKHIAAGIAEEAPDVAFFSSLLSEASPKADGSITVDVSDDDTKTLHALALRWETSARETYETDPSALGDIRSSSALVAQIEKYLQ